MSACLLSLAIAWTPAAQRQTVVVVVGAAGERQYAEAFDRWAERWQTAARQADADCVRIGTEPASDQADRDRLLAALDPASTSVEPLWLVLIGHGTFDGSQAKFNLRGPDVSAGELAERLKSCQRPLVIINCSSSSAPFINQLAGPNRVVVTATKSGYEYQFARFGDYLSAALLDESSDLDRDGQSSVLELFLTAARGVADFYEQESRLATEHGLLDDNGDGLGTPPDWFRGVRATRRAAEDAPLDGLRAHQIHLVRSDFERSVPAERRPVRDALERKIADLREQKPSLDQDEYYERLQSLLVELARWYEAEEQRAADRSSEPPRNSATAPADD